MRCGCRWVWHFEASLSICWYGHSDSVEPVSGPCGERTHQGAATLRMTHNVSSRSVEGNETSEDRAGLSTHLLMFSMETAWGVGVLVGRGGAEEEERNSCLCLNRWKDLISERCIPYNTTTYSEASGFLRLAWGFFFIYPHNRVWSKANYMYIGRNERHFLFFIFHLVRLYLILHLSRLKLSNQAALTTMLPT